MPSAPKWLFDAVDLLMPKLPSTTVAYAKLLSPSVKKISFHGDFSRLHFPVGCYVDFRVSDTQARRYSPAFADPQKGVADFIVHLHGEGTGSRFMDKLKTGDAIDMNKPRGERKYYDPSVESYVIFGDETSLAVACSFLPVLKKNNHPFIYYFELDEENKNLPADLGLENYTVFPKRGIFINENLISELPVINAVEWKEANFVLTGNVQSAQTFRKVIKNKTNGKVKLHGYWMAGKNGL